MAIVKVLMPKVAPTLKLVDYTALKTCMKWLGELAGGTAWVDKMKMMNEGQEKEKEDKERSGKMADNWKLNSGLEAFGKWC